jgi:hypothetical protein
MDAMHAYATGLLLGHLATVGVEVKPTAGVDGEYGEGIEVRLPVLADAENALVVVIAVQAVVADG